MRRELQFEIESDADVRRALEWADQFIRRGLQAGPVIMSLGRKRRTLDQNAKLWPMLADISRQVRWHGETLKPEQWKDVFTAALKGQRSVPGIDGGVVFFGSRTSRMTKREFSELIEFIYSFGAEHEVEWSEPAKKTIREREGA